MPKLLVADSPAVIILPVSAVPIGVESCLALAPARASGKIPAPVPPGDPGRRALLRRRCGCPPPPRGPGEARGSPLAARPFCQGPLTVRVLPHSSFW
mmetsp:Transcript_25299/g.44191  ORF Transcript_25299/g.44191 Transcript_25299/m.44191 type:complete len:97 (-) Transcript_25299:281-571(-)